MKKYSFKRAQKGKTAYRTPSQFRVENRQKIAKHKARGFFGKNKANEKK